MTDPCYRYYVFYEHIAQLKLLDIMTAHCDLLEFCSPDIINLIKYDEKNQSDLAQTLSVYLNCFGDGILASRKLRIHKNTLYYRLGLIKNFMNNELTDGETNYVYMFSFRILQYLGLFHPIDL
jgi:DNA-binding PucR family transcriptional regulator